MFGGFGEFPFGGDPLASIRQRMQMMDDMMRDVAFGPFLMPPPGMNNGNDFHNPLNPMDNMALSPFGVFGHGMFGGMMRQMQDMQAMVVNDPSSHVFSHSTMVSYDGMSGRQPRVIERTMRKTGDVKETKQSVRTGAEGGVGDRMSIEHKIGERSHIIEKERDRTGRIRGRQKFVNLDEGEAEDFDKEFMNRAARNLTGGRHTNIRGAIESGRSRSRKERNTSTNNESKGNAPIVTLPDEDDDSDNNDVDEHESYGKFPSSSRHGGHSRPIISELTDDGTSYGTRKKRKGPLGKFFKSNEE